MRRAWAVGLVVLFSYLLIVPAFASGPDESQLPACCRRNGKHHCAMQETETALGNIPSRFVTVSEKCPYAPLSRCTLMLPHSCALTAHSTVSNPGRGPAARVRAAEAGYRISADRTRQKRGPPGVLAL